MRYDQPLIVAWVRQGKMRVLLIWNGKIFIWKYGKNGIFLISNKKEMKMVILWKKIEKTNQEDKEWEGRETQWVWESERRERANLWNSGQRWISILCRK